MTGFRAAAGGVLASSVLAAVWAGTLPFRERTETVVPLAPVRSGEFVAVIRTRGQIQARRSRPIYTPLMADLRIAWMAPPSALLEEGEPMVRFDSSTAERDLIQRRAALERARASLDRAIADAAAAAEHDQRDLVDARLNVELAQLSTAGDAFVARLDAERGQIDLRVAQQQLRQIEAELAERQVSREAQIASLRRKLEEADAWVRIVESRIARMEMQAPLSGYAIYASNRSSITAQLGGSVEQPYRVGDQVPGGLILATIPDLTSLIINVTVEEVDRGRMQVGDEVIIRVDALPEVTIDTILSEISPMAELSLDTRVRSFHAFAALGADADPRIRPGMNGSMDIVTARIPGAMIIPAQALFTRGGKPTVHLAEPGGGFRAVEVDVLARNSDEVAVSGIAADARVALVDPTAGAGGSAAAAAGEDLP
jgi:HlyD family secretion protein